MAGGKETKSTLTIGHFAKCPLVAAPNARECIRVQLVKGRQHWMAAGRCITGIPLMSLLKAKKWDLVME